MEKNVISTLSGGFSMIVRAPSQIRPPMSRPWSANESNAAAGLRLDRCSTPVVASNTITAEFWCALSAPVDLDLERERAEAALEGPKGLSKPVEVVSKALVCPGLRARDAASPEGLPALC